MRRISRIDRSIDLLRPRLIRRAPPSYLCSACKRQANPFSTSVIREAPATTPFTEKIRRRIWGTDQPPGQEDPYGVASINEQTRSQEEDASAKTEAEEYPQALQSPGPRETSEVKASTDYEPAYTWDGLEEVGGYEDWAPDYEFQGFLPTETTTDPVDITAALHRAMVEVFTLQQAGKPLVEASSAVPGEDLTYEVKISPSADGADLQFSEGVSVEQVLQSVAPATDESMDSEGSLTADESFTDPLKDGELPAHEVEEVPANAAPVNFEEAAPEEIYAEDPLAEETSNLDYADIVASWDPSWLQISLEDPEVKFAVSAHLFCFEYGY